MCVAQVNNLLQRSASIHDLLFLVQQI